ncbi:MAG: hypothetical protein HYR63_29200 [Proteobacteria bacterium]|nr:hypothetical protein [Pseudomonadota bacterium]
MVRHKAPDQSLCSMGLPLPGQVKSIAVESYFRALRTIMNATAGVRSLGSAALSLCYVAAGRHDAFIEDGQSALDYGAAALVVREAGGIVTGFDGGPIPKTGAILASVAGLHPWLVNQFRP